MYAPSHKAAIVHTFVPPHCQHIHTHLLAIHLFFCPTDADPLGSLVEDDNHQNHRCHGSDSPSHTSEGGHGHHRGHDDLLGSFVEDDNHQNHRCHGSDSPSHTSERGHSHGTDHTYQKNIVQVTLVVEGVGSFVRKRGRTERGEWK